MADVVFSHDMSTLPHIRLSDDGPWSDRYSLSPNSTDLHLVIDPAGYSYASDTHSLRHDAIAARTAHTESRLTDSYCSPIPAINPNPHASLYPLSSLSTQDSDCEPDIFSDQSWRYESRSESYSGNQTEVDSSLSEQSWSHVNINGESQCTTSYSPFSSPLSDTFQYRDPSNLFLSTNVEGSYCGSEHSVSLREVQHYPDPDPDPEAEPKFEIDVGLDGRSFTFHQSFPLTNSFPGVIESAHPDQDRQEIEELTNDVSRQIEPPMAKIHLNPMPVTEQEECPRKRMKYSPSTPRDIQSLHKLSNNRRPMRSRAVTNLVPKQGRKVKPARSIRGPYSSRSQQRTSDRQFICVFAPYGCTSTFSAKNEWKRHAFSQHLQLGFYRCDVGCCNISNSPLSSSDIPVQSSHPPRAPNDFNRKDLFTQHQRRMHSPWASSNGASPSKQEKDAFDKSLEKVRKRCWIERRKAPQRSVCNFCGREFSGAYCWDDRMEHVGKHYEKRDIETCEDVALKEWAIQEGIVKAAGKEKWVLASPKEAAEHRTEGFQKCHGVSER